MQKIEIIENIKNINPEKIKEILLFKDENQELLFETAREVRENSIFKNNVELRSVIELSNACKQKCKYCSIWKNNTEKYLLTREEIIERIKTLANAGRRTFLLQSGEIQTQKFIDDISYCCSKIKNLFPDIEIILCLGNLKKTQYKQLKKAGASRYILKFETANEKHHKFCRPSDSIKNRLDKINTLIDLGYKVGSGNIVGLPKQTLDNLIEDLKLINSLDLSMLSATKFIPSEHSEFKNYPAGDINLTLNFLSILRILKPNCLIPSTSSLEIQSISGHERGLLAGCNTVTIHDGTPQQFKKNYAIYSDSRFSPAEEYCRNIILKTNMIPQPKLI